MNERLEWKTQSANAHETEAMAERLGTLLKGGEVIELISDLGGGKTTFTRGLVRGAGSHEHVSSPTFTINNVYEAPRFNIHHFDFYRLSEPGLIAYELHDVLKDPKVVVITEWGSIVNQVLPPKRLSITFSPTSEHGRLITITYPNELAEIIEKLKTLC
jgi:tRNA threonylcarbamoyladenosine biosynthesis protein TsaE